MADVGHYALYHIHYCPRCMKTTRHTNWLRCTHREADGGGTVWNKRAQRDEQVTNYTQMCRSCERQGY